MFILAGWIMFRDRVRRHVNYAMVAAGCGLLVLSTVVCDVLLLLDVAINPPWARKWG